MFAIRQIIDDPQETIPVPSEIRHRPTEVIFITLDAPSVAVKSPADDPVSRFCGSGRGGTTARLLAERHADRERED